MHFLKHIRKSLFNKNKLTSYLLYAIGEIILVVFGILIALGINNKSAQNQKRDLEIDLIKHAEVELYRMKGDILNDLFFLEKGLESHFRIHEALLSNKPYNDSLTFHFYWLAKDEYIYPVNTAFNRIKEEGLSIIQNDTIRTKLTSCYESIFPRLSRANPFYPDLEFFFSPYYQKHFTANNDMNLKNDVEAPDFTLHYPYPFPEKVNGKSYSITVGFVPKDFDFLKKDSEFKVLMRQAYTYRRYKIRWYKTAQRILDQALEVIDNELSRRDPESNYKTELEIETE